MVGARACLVLLLSSGFGLSWSSSSEYSYSFGEYQGHCYEIVCQDNWAPVCGDNEVTYVNECGLSVDHCLFGVELLHDGQCQFLYSTVVECGTLDCSDEDYDPVCGNNGVTYGNSCLLQLAQCFVEVEKDSDGECDEAHSFIESCDAELCSSDWDPVCGSNGVTYGSLCVLEAAKCFFDVEWARDGECESDNDCALGACFGFGDQAGKYGPVCGSDGVTYSNYCELELAGCYSGVEEEHEGSCNGNGNSGGFSHYYSSPMGLSHSVHRESTGLGHSSSWAPPPGGELDLVLSRDEIQENLPPGAVVGKLTLEGQPAGTWASVSSFTVEAIPGTDFGAFRVEGNKLKAAKSMDFEEKAKYLVMVRGASGRAATSKVFEIGVVDEAESTQAVAVTLGIGKAALVASRAGFELAVRRAAQEGVGEQYVQVRVKEVRQGGRRGAKGGGGRGRRAGGDTAVTVVAQVSVSGAGKRQSLAEALAAHLEQSLQQQDFDVLGFELLAPPTTPDPDNTSDPDSDPDSDTEPEPEPEPEEEEEGEEEEGDEEEGFELRATSRLVGVTREEVLAEAGAVEAAMAGALPGVRTEEVAIEAVREVRRAGRAGGGGRGLLAAAVEVDFAIRGFETRAAAAAAATAVEERKEEFATALRGELAGLEGVELLEVAVAAPDGTQTQVLGGTGDPPTEGGGGEQNDEEEEDEDEEDEEGGGGLPMAAVAGGAGGGAVLLLLLGWCACRARRPAPADHPKPLLPVAPAAPPLPAAGQPPSPNPATGIAYAVPAPAPPMPPPPAPAQLPAAPPPPPVPDPVAAIPPAPVVEPQGAEGAAGPGEIDLSQVPLVHDESVEGFGSIPGTIPNTPHVGDAGGAGAEAAGLESSVCQMCLDAPRTVLCLPCRHASLCAECFELVMEGDKLCVICRTPIAGSEQGQFTETFLRSFRQRTALPAGSGAAA